MRVNAVGFSQELVEFANGENGSRDWLGIAVEQKFIEGRSKIHVAHSAAKCAKCGTKQKDEVGDRQVGERWTCSDFELCKNLMPHRFIYVSA